MCGYFHGINDVPSFHYKDTWNLFASNYIKCWAQVPWLSVQQAKQLTWLNEKIEVLYKYKYWMDFLMGIAPYTYNVNDRRVETNFGP